MEMNILEPVVQYGFLGFAVVLLGVVIWLIQKLLTVLDQTNRVIAANTEAIEDLANVTEELVRANRSLHEKVITRPCMVAQE